MIIKILVLAFAVFVVLSPEGIAQPGRASPEGAQVETQTDWHQYWGYCTYTAQVWSAGTSYSSLFNDLPTLPFKVFQRLGERAGELAMYRIRPAAVGLVLKNHFRTAVRHNAHQIHNGLRSSYVTNHDCYVYSYGTSSHRAAILEYEALYKNNESFISTVNLQFPPECSPVMMTDDMLMGTQCDWFETIR